MKYSLFSIFLLIFCVSITMGQKCQVVDQWISKVDPRVLCKNTPDLTVDLSDSDAMSIFVRLIKNKGRQSNSAILNASLSPLNSQRFETPSVEVASLYYITYIFNGNSDFASAIALQNGDDTINSKKAIAIAFRSYKKWLNRVKTIGIAEARRKKLDPLAGSDVRWY